MLSNQIKKNLELIADRLNQEKVSWLLTGSVNLALQGVDISTCHDIDIVVLPSDLKMVENIFQNDLVYSIKTKTSLKDDETKFKTFKFKIDNIEVEVFGADRDLYPISLLKNKESLIKVKIGNNEIFCYPLEIEKEIYK